MSSNVRKANPLVRVVHVIKGLNRGGAEVLLAEGLRVADRNTFEFAYAHFLPGQDEIAPLLRELGAPVVTFGRGTPLSMIASVPALVRFLRRTRAHVVHAHMPLAAAVARVAARIARVPLIYTEHNVVEPYHPLTKLAARTTWPLQRLVVAVSPDVEASVQRTFGRGVETVTVLNGIDAAAFQTGGGAAVRANLGISPDAPVVGTVARFRPQKRLDLWLRAAARLHAARPDVSFLLVGGGEQDAYLREQVASLGLAATVHFAGIQTRTGPFLDAMDLFMMSSEYEGFGLAPVEAMAAGVPILATAVEGIRNVVRDGETGLLVPFGATVADDLSSAALQILSATPTRMRLVEAGRRAASEEFGIVRMQRELEALYRRVAEGTR